MKDKHVRPIDAALSRLRSTYTPGHGRPSEDVEEHVDADVTDHAVPPAEELFWPPPGLEKIHGRIPRLTGDFAVGALILVITLIWLGFFAATPRNAGGWGAMVALVINFILLVRAYAGLRQLMMYADLAVARGYPRQLVWQVATDAQRDAGLLLLGKGNYTGITRSELTHIAHKRIAASILALCGALWIPLTFPLIAVLGFTGVLSDVAVWLALAAPALLLLFVSVYIRYREWQARRPFRAPEIMDREVAAQASAYSQLYASLGIRRRAKNTSDLKLATGAAWLAAFFFLVPVALAFVTTAIPRFMATTASAYMVGRFPTLQLLQHHRTPADSSVSAITAGQALHNIRLAGVDPQARHPLLQPATRQYVAVFNQQFEPSANPEFWEDSLFVWIRRGALTPAQRQLVEQAARHPSAEDMRVLARARTVEVPATRWQLSATDTVAVMTLPYVNTQSMRGAAQGRIAAAALAFERGAHAEAEAVLREIISVGFLLRDQTPTMTDAFNGHALLRMGGRSLASLYRQTGRGDAAAELRTAVDAAQPTQPERGTNRSLDVVYRYVLNEHNPRAARWETFAALQTTAPCLSFYAAVFGPTNEHKTWVERAHKALVRTPEEERYFTLMRKGIAAKTFDDDPRCGTRTIRVFRPLLTGY